MAKRPNWPKLRDYWVRRNIAPATDTKSGWAHYTLKELAAEFGIEYQAVRNASSRDRWRDHLKAAREQVRAAASARAQEEAAESVAEVYTAQLRICNKALRLAERQLDLWQAAADAGFPIDVRDVTGLLNSAMAHQRQAAGLGETFTFNLGEDRRERIEEHERLRGLFEKLAGRVAERLEDMEPAGHA